jgi:dienelactone hydrolase
MVRAAALLAIVLLAPSGATAPLWSPAGGSDASAVGVRVLEPRDPARGGRPLQIVVWYPARAAAAAPLRYRDYFALTLAERSLLAATAAEIDAAAAGWVDSLVGNGVLEAAARAWLLAPMAGRRDAPPDGGAHPLVLLAQGNGQSAADQAALAEWLAGQGFVVATSPSPVNLSGQMASEADLLPKAEEQADDLAFVARAVAHLPGVDARRLAVVGHSFGARGALLFALREPGVRALVSLDGGIGTATGKAAMLTAADAAPRGTEAAILHLYEELDDYMRPDFELLRRVARGPLALEPVPSLHHHHFTTLGFAAASFPEIARATGAGPELPAALATVARRTRDWLRSALAEGPVVSTGR